MVDIQDLKSWDRKVVRVQFPPWALYNNGIFSDEKIANHPAALLATSSASHLTQVTLPSIATKYRAGIEPESPEAI